MHGAESQEDDVYFGSKDAIQKASTRGQDCKNLNGYQVLSLGADIGWDKREPDTDEYQHAEGDELSFIEGVRQIPR
ncbi:hypothetical protein NDU88_000953 [Pleurodeles waltl]|uniref:Uncharacterized protein n=1 Tax=Pleurodeles waltl TaxID=8319 RepID=A0AAV7LXB3_PLEWA|nr:hypothetical protein NDU88_000953 [Pleurodeles waltl]